MGGPGSGRGIPSRYTLVEHCSAVDAGAGARWVRRPDASRPRLVEAVRLDLGARPSVDVRIVSHRLGTSPLVRAVDEATADVVGLGVVRLQTAPLVATPAVLGGLRWYFRCDCGRRCRKLYRPVWAGRFACRDCHRLRHKSQRLSRRERWRHRAAKLVRRLGGEAEDGLVYKPKWMRWRTFNRLMEHVQLLNDAATVEQMAHDRVLQRLLRSYGTKADGDRSEGDQSA
jgi:hypothetical protein